MRLIFTTVIVYLLSNFFIWSLDLSLSSFLRFLISNSSFFRANSCSFFSRKYKNVLETDLLFFCFGDVKSSYVSTDSLRFISPNVSREAFLNYSAISVSLFVFNSFWCFFSHEIVRLLNNIAKGT